MAPAFEIVKADVLQLNCSRYSKILSFAIWRSWMMSHVWVLSSLCYVFRTVKSVRNDMKYKYLKNRLAHLKRCAPYWIYKNVGRVMSLFGPQKFNATVTVTQSSSWAFAWIGVCANDTRFTTCLEKDLELKMKKRFILPSAPFQLAYQRTDRHYSAKAKGGLWFFNLRCYQWTLQKVCAKALAAFSMFV